MNLESATKSLTAPFYVTFTFLHLVFHIIEMVNNNNAENSTFSIDTLNNSDQLFNYSDSAIYAISGKY